jgi:hypothetical protein
MTKLSMLGIIGGAALLVALPVSLQWSQKSVALSLDTADARIGRPLTPFSVAGVHRRAYRRAAYAAAVGGVGYGSYYGGYGYPGYGYGYSAYAPTAPSYGTGYGYGYGGYGYPAYSYGYGYPSYGYGLGTYAGYRVARRVAIHRARWR